MEYLINLGIAGLFLSTPSARRATVWCFLNSCSYRISIHALREEGDDTTPIPPTAFIYFYPRPPRGGRQHRQRQSVWKDVFLSTPSARRATVPPSRQGLFAEHFYPRPPRGGRPMTSSR